MMNRQHEGQDLFVDEVDTGPNRLHSNLLRLQWRKKDTKNAWCDVIGKSSFGKHFFTIGSIVL